MFNFPGLDTCSKHTIAWLYIGMFGIVFSSRSNSFLQFTCRSYQRTYQVSIMYRWIFFLSQIETFHVLMKGAVKGSKNIIGFSANLPNCLSVLKGFAECVCCIFSVENIGKVRFFFPSLSCVWYICWVQLFLFLFIFFIVLCILIM